MEDNNKKSDEKSKEKNSDDDEDDSDGNLTSFNTKSSLRARLYNRNRELVKNVFGRNDDRNKVESELLNFVKENKIDV